MLPPIRISYISSCFFHRLLKLRGSLGQQNKYLQNVITALLILLSLRHRNGRGRYFLIQGPAIDSRLTQRSARSLVLCIMLSLNYRQESDLDEKRAVNMCRINVPHFIHSKPAECPSSSHPWNTIAPKVYLMMMRAYNVPGSGEIEVKTQLFALKGPIVLVGKTVIKTGC